MTSPVLLRVHEVDIREWPYKLRMPFRFGGTTKTHGAQVVVRARVSIGDGPSTWGCAAESLSAKWFDKNPALSDEANHDQLRLSIEMASSAYKAHGPDTAFGYAEKLYDDLMAQSAAQMLSPLIGAYGAALLDRCLIDALGRLTKLSFWTLMQRNTVGMRAASWAPDLGTGFDAGQFLAGLTPLRALQVRHTVGLVDPITAQDQAAGSAVADGLPETLEEVVSRYQHRYYKVKIGGQPAVDLARLEAIAAVLDTLAHPYHVTLDGNEQFESVEPVVALLRTMSEAPCLRRFCESMLWIEQPLARHVALSESVRSIDALHPVIIDESDADFGCFPRAIELGYRGVSSKICKGLYKSLFNLARCDARYADVAAGRLFMSAEDLTTLPGISLQQDLALVALLGLEHVEKNAHHFVDGMRHRPKGEQRAFVQAHPDLYRFESLPNGEQVARMVLHEGGVRISSLDCPGFASLAEPDWSSLPPAPVSRWHEHMKNVTA